MGGLLAVVAGTGMFCLIAALIGSFLTQVCKLPVEKAMRIRTGIVIGVGFFLLQWLAAGLLRAVMFGSADMMDFATLFSSRYALDNIMGLQDPGAVNGFVNRVLASVGHAAGSVLFGRYVEGGFFLSVATGCFSCCLLLRAFHRWGNAQNARNTLCVVLSFPGMVFAFLPGWIAAAFLCLSGLVCWLSRTHIGRLLSDAWAAPLLGVGGVLSGGLLFAMSMGLLG